MIERLHLVFDLDGTLFDADDDVDFSNAESIRRGTRPHALACDLVRRAYDRRHTVTYLTGRAVAHYHTTWQQIERARLPPGQLVMQKAWDDYEAMERFKARELRQRGAHLYVGDTKHDANAAMLAGVAFLHADHWRRGIIPQHILDLPYTTPPEAARVG